MEKSCLWLGTHLEELVDLLQIFLSGQAVESVGDQTIEDTNKKKKRKQAVLVRVPGVSIAKTTWIRHTGSWQSCHRIASSSARTSPVMSQSTRATPPNSLPTPTHRLVVVLEVLGDIPRGLAVRAQADEPVHDVLVLDAPVVQHGKGLFDQLVRLGGTEGHEGVDLGRGRRRGVVHCRAGWVSVRVRSGQ
jgi:hypothetical protein